MIAGRLVAKSLCPVASPFEWVRARMPGLVVVMWGTVLSRRGRGDGGGMATNPISLRQGQLEDDARSRIAYYAERVRSMRRHYHASRLSGTQI